MNTRVPFAEVARLPAPGDNAAIAIRRIDPGVVITTDAAEFPITSTVLEGHRFAVSDIKPGNPLLSWGLPFGQALTEIWPGDYICNEKGLGELRHRRLDFQIPQKPNFKDHRIDFTLDEAATRSAEQVAPVAHPLTFDGFARTGGRGSGTRNYVVVMGTSSRTASIARLLAERFRDVPKAHPNIDGVVPVAHTEGGGSTKPNNLEFTLRTLAGFMVHPNVAAVLAIDTGAEHVNNRLLREFMIERGYPLEHVPHRFLTAGDGLAAAMREGAKQIEALLPEAAGFARTPQSMAHLRLGLQCGGSDAFSGVSANPLLGCIAREVIRYGGSANLAETSELIGAEPYLLARVRDVETARKFLRQRDRFQEWAGWHGHSAEGNPSGGNLYRGLYNIIIKSIGAALKKHPDTRLDYCIDYSEPMTAPGYYFMDSPGNDLESIAGQVGAGCNLILFTTGNGSITNFPFVPTIKIVTTTGRFNLLRTEMDFNAGRYLDGTPMEELAGEAFAQTCRIASGEKSIGERAGHSQVQLWRDWAQTSGAKLDALQHRPKPAGKPVPLDSSKLRVLAGNLAVHPTAAPSNIGLIVPTSLCASQVAGMIATKLNAGLGTSSAPSGVAKFVALPHTEGCGNSRGESEELYMRTMTGYAHHPSIARALLLEHGCEKTHNDEMRAFMAEHRMDASRLGFASIQLEGGIENVTRNVMNWFAAGPGPATTVATSPDPSAGLVVGFAMEGAPTPHLANSLAMLAAAVVQAGGTAVMPGLEESKTVLEQLGVSNVRATIRYGEPIASPGLHLMETNSNHLVESLTGLGATGARIVFALVYQPLAQAHPFVPVIQLGTLHGDDVDCVTSEDISPEAIAGKLARLLDDTLAGKYTPRAVKAGNVDFQVSRGWVGVSL